MKKLLYILILAMVISLAACSSNEPASIDSNKSPASQAASSSEVKVFSLDELKSFNGENGNPAYVAVDGIVYDVSAVPQWRNGKHNGQVAGKDLSNEISKLSPHGKSVLKKLPVVGKLADK